LKIGAYFLAPEKGEMAEQPLKAGFAVISTLTTDSTRQNQRISVGLRNRFVTIAVKHTNFDSKLFESIANSLYLRRTARFQKADNYNYSNWTISTLKKDNQFSNFFL
jgi:hypothetical protein